MSLGRTCLTGKKDTGIGKNYMLCGRGEQLNCLGHGIWKAVPNTLLNISVTVHAFFFAFFSHRPDQVSNSLPSAPKLSAQITTETSTKNVLRKALFGTRMWRDLNIAQREIGEREKKGMERGKRDERNEHYFGLQFFSHLYLISFNNNLLGSSTLKQTITFFQTVGPCSGQSRGFLKHGVISPVEYVLAHPRSCLRTSRASQHISVHWTDLSLCSELWHSARAHPRLCALTPGYLHVCQSVVQCHQWETIIKAKSLFL